MKLGETLEKVFFVRANLVVRVESAGRKRTDLCKVVLDRRAAPGRSERCAGVMAGWS